LFIGCAVLLAACSGQPTSPDTAITNASQRPPLKADGTLDTEAMAKARKLGYQAVNEDGEVLYCRTEAKMGSRVEKETICLTPKQIDDLREETKHSLGEVMRQTSPPAGR